MSALPKELVEKCKQKLLLTKEDILNRIKDARENFNRDDNKGGDEGDLTVRALEESQFLRLNERFRKQLVEIEMALARIEAGSYGVCEETEEVIGNDRLLAIPWTRLSLEGAEIRESVGRRYAR